MPPASPISSCSSTVPDEADSGSLVSSTLRGQDDSSPSFTTSSAFDLNFNDDSSRDDWLLFRIYRSSLAGKLADKGTAIALLPKIESKVTSSTLALNVFSDRYSRTYIVIAIFDQKRNPLAFNAISFGAFNQSFFRLRDIIEQLSIGVAFL